MNWTKKLKGDAQARTAFTPIILSVMLLVNSVAPGMQAATIRVMNNADNGPGTLRASLAGAANGDTIVYSASLPATISLTSGELLVTKSLAILGPGPDKLVVDANNASRVFRIAPSNTVSISGLTVTNGYAYSNLGGAILNDRATLTVSNCTITESFADFGGGILNNGLTGSATLKVKNCTVSGNLAGLGGGLYNYGQSKSALLEISSSTFSSNVANVYGGGGIFNDGRSSGSATIKISSCTFSGNSGNVDVGGIYNYGSTGYALLDMGNTIFKAGASGQNILNFAGTVTSRGYNLSSDGTGPNNGSTDRLNTDPLLGPAQNNGGPTPTHALLPGSPAIDKGNRGDLTTDQRGRPRPADFSSIANATGGDGSDIGAFERQLPALTLRPSLSGGDVLIGFETEVGLSYRIKSKDAMTTAVWTTVADNVAGTGSIVTVTNLGAGRLPKCFYRGELVP